MFAKIAYNLGLANRVGYGTYEGAISQTPLDSNPTRTKCSAVIYNEKKIPVSDKPAAEARASQILDMLKSQDGRLESFVSHVTHSINFEIRNRQLIVNGAQYALNSHSGLINDIIDKISLVAQSLYLEPKVVQRMLDNASQHGQTFSVTYKSDENVEYLVPKRIAHLSKGLVDVAAATAIACALVFGYQYYNS